MHHCSGELSLGSCYISHYSSAKYTADDNTEFCVRTISETVKIKCNKTVISVILAIKVDFLADLYNSVLLVVGGGGLLLPASYSLVNRGFKLN